MIPQTEQSSFGRALEGLVKDYIKDEQFVRDRYVQEVRRNNLYFSNIQNIVNIGEGSGVVGDWTTFNDYLSKIEDDFDIDELDLDIKFINVYKAYVESLVAALSSQLPTTRFFPSDADNADDISTAQSFEKIIPLIRRHNKAKILLLQVLSIFINEGVVAARNFIDRNEKYGFADKPIEATVVNQQSILHCPNCNSELGSFNSTYEAGDNPVVERDITESQDMALCPNCEMNYGNGQVYPIIENIRNLQTAIVDFDRIAKIRAKIEVYGLTNVRFPAYCTSQEEIPALVLEREQSVALVESIYPELKNKITENNIDTPETNKWARTNPFYIGEIPKYTCTVQEAWVRSWALRRIKDIDFEIEEATEVTESNELDSDEVVSSDATLSNDNLAPYNDPASDENKEVEKTLGEVLAERYPNGLKVVLVNGEYVTHSEESMDDHWTISVNPLYRHLLCKSIGSSIIPIQDLENDNTAITEQTIEHGVAETFVDSDTLDINAYSQGESRPGNVTGVKRPDPSKSIGDSFFQTKPAALSQEVGFFSTRINEKGQFISGASPSIYGGNLEGSETAAVYSMSRAQALQRLTIPWNIICELWSQMEYKSALEYATTLDYDEIYPVKAGATFKNVYIEQLRLKGRVSCVENESGEYFPTSWAQERDAISSLIQLNNEFINAALMHPENRSLVAKLAGPKDMYVPGDDARKKQLAEIAELLKTPPAMEDNMGMPLSQPMPTVMVDPDFDEHDVEYETIKAWANSSDGQFYKKEYPQQYMNVLLHGRQHKFFLDQMAMEQAQAQAQSQNQENNKEVSK